MKVTDYIDNKILRLPKGYVFTYEDFISEVEKKEAIIKALNRMAASGKISKLSKGKYYKSETTVFGELPPDQYQIVKDLLEDEGRIIGYLTGLSIYNRLGLTTQLSNTIEIGRNDFRPKLKRGHFTIIFIRQKNIITKDNIPLLQILDAIRYIKKIPDTTVAASAKRLLSIINKLSEDNIKTISRLSFKYPPSTRAILGAMLEKNANFETLDGIRKTLNLITTYKIKGISEAIPPAKNWNII